MSFMYMEGEAKFLLAVLRIFAEQYRIILGKEVKIDRTC